MSPTWSLLSPKQIAKGSAIIYFCKKLVFLSSRMLLNNFCKCRHFVLTQKMTRIRLTTYLGLTRTLHHYLTTVFYLPSSSPVNVMAGKIA